MNEFNVPFGVAGFLVIMLFARLVSITIHELGHAWAARILTKRLISVYVGFRGNEKPTVQFRLGKIQFHYQLNPLKWNGGLCQFGPGVLPLKAILIIVAGPLVSLLLSLGCFWLITTASLHWNLALFLLGVSAGIDFVFTAFPAEIGKEAATGKRRPNDAKVIVQQLRQWRLIRKYAPVGLLWENESYTTVAGRLEELLEKNPGDEKLIALMTDYYILDKNYTEVVRVYETYGKNHVWEINRQINLGVAQINLGKAADAIETYSEVLQREPANDYALNNRAYAFIVAGKYEEALNDLDRMRKTGQIWHYGISNRAFARIRLGRLEEGLKDVWDALRLDEKNAHAYYTLGLYHLRTGNAAKALAQFDKALSLEKVIIGLDADRAEAMRLCEQENNREDLTS